MSDIFQSDSKNTIVISKLSSDLNRLSVSLSEKDDSQISNILSETLSTFKRFFEELDTPTFTPELIVKNDIVSHKLYNNNLKSIFTDLNAFYRELNNLEQAQITSFNYSQVVVSEIISRANSLASTVLDLNILNNFTRGDVIVAGDDFRNLDYIDTDSSLASDRAELLFEGGGIGLARDSSRDLIDNKVDIKITPLSPLSSDATTRVRPTVGNLERFYEGNYYNFLGAARPENGAFNIQYIYDPEKGELNPDKDSPRSENKRDDKPGGNLSDFENNNGGISTNPEKYKGEFVEYGATEEQKARARLKMLDGNPSTFWEGEYLYRVEPLLGDILSQIPDKDRGPDGDVQDTGGSVTIDLNQAEKNAQQYDFEGRDLIVEIVITFPETRNINMVVLNPILFGSEAFPYVREVSTAESNDAVFKVVDGWNSLKFAKTITPEANEYLTDSQLGITLSPNRYDYAGKGVYPFPVRKAKKVKLIVAVDRPVAQPYERVYVLLNKTVTTKGTITTTTDSGLLGGLF